MNYEGLGWTGLKSNSVFAILTSLIQLNVVCLILLVTSCRVEGSQDRYYAQVQDIILGPI